MALADSLLVGAILAALGLAIWAKVSGQTIPELIGDLIDTIRDRKDDAVESTVEVFARD